MYVNPNINDFSEFLKKFADMGIKTLTEKSFSFKNSMWELGCYGGTMTFFF